MLSWRISGGKIRTGDAAPSISSTGWPVCRPLSFRADGTLLPASGFLSGLGPPESRSRGSYWSRLHYTSSGPGQGGGVSGSATATGTASGVGAGYSKADHQFLLALKRLTRIQMRPIEQEYVDLGRDDIFDCPGSTRFRVANWTFTTRRPSGCAVLSERRVSDGDDFHHHADWDRSMTVCASAPDLPHEDLSSDGCCACSTILASGSRSLASGTSIRTSL